jgi:hypothetical protein
MLSIRPCTPHLLMLTTFANVMPPSEHIHPLSSCLANETHGPLAAANWRCIPTLLQTSFQHCCSLPPQHQLVRPATFTQLEPLSCLCYSRSCYVIRFLSSPAPPSVGQFSAPSPITSSNTRPLHTPVLAFCLKSLAPQYTLRVPRTQLQARKFPKFVPRRTRRIHDVWRSMAVSAGGADKCRQPFPSSLLYDYVQRSGMVSAAFNFHPCSSSLEITTSARLGLPHDVAHANFAPATTSTPSISATASTPTSYLKPPYMPSSHSSSLSTDIGLRCF